MSDSARSRTTHGLIGAGVFLGLAALAPASAAPINNTGLSPQECYQKDSGCTQFCGKVTGALRYECFGICDRMLDRCLDTGDWTDSAEASPGGGPGRPDRRDQLSAAFLQMLMTLSDADRDGTVSDNEIQSLKDRIHKASAMSGEMDPKR